MLPAPKYLEWARRHYGRVRYDLASSGIPTASPADFAIRPALGQPDAWGRLRAAIARHNQVPPAEAAGVLGASHGLWLGFTAMLDRGDEALVEEPTYEPLLIAAEAAGASVRRFDRGPACRFQLDPERVIAAVTPKTKVVAITNLHNPSGSRASDAAMRSIARRLDAQGGFLFVDEIYAPFDDFVDRDGVFHLSARRLYGNIVTTGSLTKAYGLGPQRVGWLLGPEFVIERVISALIATVGELPFVWMETAVSALERAFDLAVRGRRLLGNKRAKVGEWIAERPGLTWSDPQAGLFGLAMLRKDVDVRPAIAAGIGRHEVIVAPGFFFGIPNAFRLAWSLEENLLAEALDRLERLLLEAGLL